MKTRSKIVLGLTIGDPAGVGPELVARALKKFSRHPRISLRVIGSAGACRPGRLSKTGAGIALAALEESVRLLKSGEIDAVANAPVHKENLARVGFDFPGQTEFYADSFGLKEDDVTMMLASGAFRVALVTTHCSLRQALKKLSSKLIVRRGRQVLESLQRMGCRRPRLAVAGLNPHAGEGGRFGDEESRIVAPAVRELQELGLGSVSGPWSPDAVFRSAWQGEFDAVLSLYHDQGLIPLKMVGFDSGVNVTLGLPCWRTAPDHGTALELAGTGKASPLSFFSAIELAAALVQRRASGRSKIKL